MKPQRRKNGVLQSKGQVGTDEKVSWEMKEDEFIVLSVDVRFHFLNKRVQVK